MNIKSITFILSLAILTLISCGKNRKCDQACTAKSPNSINTTNESILFDSTAYTLLQDKCMICHSSVGKTHDEMLAPPLFAVKRRYNKEYPQREDFINGIVNWAENPSEEKAIMYGAIDKFKTMPYLNFEKDDLTKIAAFIYDNEIDKPAWFEGHFKEMHPDEKRGNKARKNPRNQ